MKGYKLLIGLLTREAVYLEISACDSKTNLLKSDPCEFRRSVGWPVFPPLHKYYGPNLVRARVSKPELHSQVFGTIDAPNEQRNAVKLRHSLIM